MLAVETIKNMHVCWGRGIMPSISCLLPLLLLASNFLFQIEACLANVYLFTKNAIIIESLYQFVQFVQFVVQLCL